MPSWSRAERFDEQRPAVVFRVPCRRVGQARRDVAIAAGCGEDAHVARRFDVNTTTASAFGDFEQCGRGLACEQLLEDRGVDQSPDDAFVGVEPATVPTRWTASVLPERVWPSSRSRCAPSM